MSTESPEYLNVLQHRQIEKQINSTSFMEASQINDSSISTPNASKLAVEVFQENQRLLAQMEQMKQSFSSEIRKLRDEYDLRFSKFSEKEEKYVTLLKEKDDMIRNLKMQIGQIDKDSIIQKQNEQIQKLNVQYENALDSRCFQAEKLQAALEKIDNLTKEVQLLKNSNNIPNCRYEPLSPPIKKERPDKFQSQTTTQIMPDLGSSSFIPPPDIEYNRPFNNRNFEPNYSNLNNYSGVKAATPDIRYGRKRAPPNHPALAEQMPFYLNQKTDDLPQRDVQMDGFTFTLRELRTTLQALQSEKAEIEKRLSKATPVENTKYFAGPLMQRENDEKQLDELDKVIGRIRLELRRMGKL